MPEGRRREEEALFETDNFERDGKPWLTLARMAGHRGREVLKAWCSIEGREAGDLPHKTTSGNERGERERGGVGVWRGLILCGCTQRWGIEKKKKKQKKKKKNQKKKPVAFSPLSPMKK